jgi:hypothetical protein
MNALEELDRVSFQVSWPGRDPFDVVLVHDLQELIGCEDGLFNAAIDAIKFTATVLEYNLRCFFYTINQGDIMTKEAAIAVAAKCAPVSEFSVQMCNYVGQMVDFLEHLGVDFPDAD